MWSNRNNFSLNAVIIYAVEAHIFCPNCVVFLYMYKAKDAPITTTATHFI